MDNDPLSEALQLLDVTDVSISRLEVGGDWSFRFPSKPHLKFHSLLRGECWIRLPDRPRQHLTAGDTFLLANAPPFVLSRDPDKAPKDAAIVFGTGLSLYRHGGEETVIMGGGFVFAREDATALLSAMPSFLLVKSGTSGAHLLNATLSLLDHELVRRHRGSTLVVRRLVDILLIQALRSAGETQSVDDLGWIGALNDRRIGPALRLMHRQVDHDWAVGELAAAVGMSRASFAARFKRMTGMAPVTYLTWWRMHRAKAMLRRGDQGLSTIAGSLGYASATSFSNAFRRTFGTSPGCIYRAAKDIKGEEEY